MPLQMASQLLTRRAFIASSISLVSLIFLFHQAHLSSRTPRFLGKLEETRDCLDNVFNSTLGFERIFVIGLPSRTDRRDSMILAAGLSGIEVEFIDGVVGSDVVDQAIPTASGQGRMSDPSIGSWRAHLNAIQEIVRRNISTALILEDDADWDIRIKEQLRNFALSSRALTQPLVGTSPSFADPTYPIRTQPSTAHTEISFGNLPSTITLTFSPYGDHWKTLWLGQCAMNFPYQQSEKIPSGRVVQTDHTVPQQQFLETLFSPDNLKVQYPNHTRVVHHAQDGVCSLVYAVNQASARDLLYSIGLKHVDLPFDIALRQFCDGTGGRKYHQCLTVQPSLFQHHRPAGSIKAESDISDHGDGFRDVSVTPVIRWSTRMNFETLLQGRTDFVDQWPDV